MTGSRRTATSMLADAVEEAARGVPLYLRSCAAQGRGDSAGVETLLDASVGANPQLAPALCDLAELRSTRGEAQEARRLYERGGGEPSTPGVAQRVELNCRPASANLRRMVM